MITIGHDGEFFVTHGDDVVPSQDIIPGTKECPHQLATCMLHRDNTMGEFGTTATDDEDTFVSQILAAQAEIAEGLAGMGMGMLFKPHHVFKDFELTHPETHTFGCMPDFDCYIREEGFTPSADAAGCLRSAGGHVHVGFDVQSEDDVIDTVFAMEQLVGLYTVLHDTDTRRRELYGKAGRYRPKPYGLEYRVPSNFWYASEEHMRQIFRRARAAVEHREVLAANFKDSSIRESVAAAINTGDSGLAGHLNTQLNLGEFVYAA